MESHIHREPVLVEAGNMSISYSPPSGILKGNRRLGIPGNSHRLPLQKRQEASVMRLHMQRTRVVP